MTVPSVTAFRLRFPEFAASDTFPSEQIQFALDEAELFTATAPVNKATIATLYLAAHIIAAGQIAADTGGLTLRHQSIGRISETYQDARNADANKSAVGNDLQTTMYGRRYMRIMASNSSFATIGSRSQRWGC